MPQRNVSAGVAPSEQALLDLWDLVDNIRLKQSEYHATVIARRALEAARKPQRKEATMPQMSGIKSQIYTALDDLESTMDPDAYQQLLAPILRQLQAAQQRMTQGVGDASRAAATGKARRQNEDFWDGVSDHLQTTGGHSL